MQTDIKILVRLHHSLVLVFFFGFFPVRGQRLNLALSLRVVIRSMCFRAWITVQFESQGRPLDGLMLGGCGGGEKKQVPLHPQIPICLCYDTLRYKSRIGQIILPGVSAARPVSACTFI